MRKYFNSVWFLILAWMAFCNPARADDTSSKLVFVQPDGRLGYHPYTDQGDAIPDFSNCGYRGGGVPLPVVPVKMTLSPAPTATDDTSRIQDAIDQLSQMPPEKGSVRGALLLKRGQYRIAGALHVTASGVVLRGEGQGEDGTVLIAAGTGVRVLIQVRGPSGAKTMDGTRQRITADYVPVGAKIIPVADGTKFKPGDTVMVSREGNADWIHAVGMDRITPRPTDPRSTHQWTPFALNYDRVVTRVDGNQITLDAPITCAIETKWGGGSVWRYDDSGRIQQVGVENLRGVSEFNPNVKAREQGVEYYSDEHHALRLVSFENAENCWARDLTAEHFWHGVSDIQSGAKWVTIKDCSTLDPVSVLTGERRYAYLVDGQLNLVEHCYSRKSRHAFVLGAHVPGPNVFLDCKAEINYATSEPHHRWSTGGLFDNVTADMAIQDRQWMGSGHGWAGANYVVWNCEGSLVCQQPPTAQNFAIGFVGTKNAGAFKRPDGWWESLGSHVKPQSLYLKQLADRLNLPAEPKLSFNVPDSF